MKNSFKSIKELTDYINSKLIKAMDEVGEKALAYMKEYVEDKLKMRQPLIYERTWEYLNSISRLKAELKADGSIETVIYYDTDKIFPYMSTSVFESITNYPMDREQTWGWHTSFDGTSVVDFIPLWLEYGTNNPYYSHTPIGGIINLEKWVEDNFRNELKKEFKKQGIQTK